MKILPVFIILLGGCTTVSIENHGKSRWYAGIVRVEFPEKRGKISAVDVKMLGAGWESGPFIGWQSGNWVTANPNDCQLIIIIKSAAQAENAQKVIKSLGGQQPCVIDYTHSLQP